MSIIEISPNMKEFLKSYASNRNKNMLDEDREEKKKENMKNYYYQRKNLLNHLINLLESQSLEKVSFNK